MIINLIFNSFGKYKRQDIAIQSFLYLRHLFPNNIRLWNIQFEDEAQTFENPYPEIEVIYKLGDSRKVVPNSVKKLPMMNELYNVGLELEGEYTVICNSDIILMPHLIETILNKKPETLAISRMDIEDIGGFDWVLKQQVKPVRYCVGQDCFVFENTWMERNKSLFQVPFLMGNPVFDIYWSGIIQIFGGKEHVVNNYPPMAFHIFHGDDSIKVKSVERDWNEQLLYENPLNKIVFNIMTYFLNKSVMKRTPVDKMLVIPPEEHKWCDEFFHFMHYNRNVF